MLELPTVTLACADTANPELALRALSLSAARVRFARTLFLTDRGHSVEGIEVRPIPRLDSRDAYSQYVLKELVRHVDTPHVLLIQWDGYVLDPAAWREDFLACDYLGAKWSWRDGSESVGNGGFSLRSRKLLLALQDTRIRLAGAEDETICRTFRPLLEQEYGIVFGSEALADAFAFEASYPLGRPFGFHGLYNFCRFVPPDELTSLVAWFTPEIARSPQLAQLGRNCIACGQWHAAEAIFRRILAEDPAQAEAASQLALATRNAAIAPPVGRNDPCPCGSGKRYKHCHGAAGASRPLETAAQKLQRALSLHARGDADAALPIYQDVLADEPDNSTAQHYLGVIWYQRSNLSLALPLLERAVAAKPTDPEFHNNLGLALAAADRTDEAIAEYRSTLSLNPDHAVAWNNLGLALQAKNEVRDGIEAFRRALHLKPDFLRARWNLALALLLDRQFGEGWRHYDARLELPEIGGKLHRFPGAAWAGTSAQTVLVYIEQGLGDTIQFARYAKQMAAVGARCILRCPVALAPLLATIPGVSAINLERDPLPPYDAYLPLLSLPRLFGTSPETIPAEVPYLAVPEANRAAARRILARAAGKRRIGICWAGNPAHSNDRNRSIALAVLAPLFAATDAAWFSLQAGAAAGEQLATTPGAGEVLPLPLGTELVDTAALIAELDLVVTVDTGIAHLAGALARPTWLLLPYAPDWRWQLERDDSPWYPTARLFRQPEARNWHSVIERVKAELETAPLSPRASSLSR